MIVKRTKNFAYPFRWSHRKNVAIRNVDKQAQLDYFINKIAKNEPDDDENGDEK